jgi:hypothetical protein
MSDKTQRQGSGESYRGIVPTKPPNEGLGGPQEAGEGRARSKENQGPSYRYLAQAQRLRHPVPPSEANWHSPSNFRTAWSGASARLLQPKDCLSARWSAERCSRCCPEGEGVGEPQARRQRALQLEYRFDRLLPDKLAHVYQLLVPDRHQPIRGETPKAGNQPRE